MRRILWWSMLFALFLTTAAADAQSKHSRPAARTVSKEKIRNYDGRLVTPDARGVEIPVFTEADIDTMFASRGMRIIKKTFHEGFTPHGTRDIPWSIFERVRNDILFAPGKRHFSLGTTDPEHTRDDPDKRSQTNNYSIGEARANWAFLVTRGKLEVMSESIPGYKRGFWHIIAEPLAPARRDTLYLKTTERRTEVINRVPVFWFRPTIGFGGAWLDKQHVITPTISGVLGARFGRYNISGYATAGQDFQPQNRGTSALGLQLGDDLGPYVRVGYRSTWTGIRGDGHNYARAEGGEAGIGYGFSVARIGLSIPVLQYADLPDGGGDVRPAITVNADFGPLFQAK